MTIEERMAERVRSFRRAQKLSQEELADRAGLHRTFISQIERAVKKTTVHSAEKVAKALNVSLGDLLDP